MAYSVIEDVCHMYSFVFTSIAVAYFSTLVCTSIVNQNYFDVRQCLCQNAFYAFGQKSFGVIYWDDDGYEWHTLYFCKFIYQVVF